MGAGSKMRTHGFWVLSETLARKVRVVRTRKLCNRQRSLCVSCSFRHSVLRALVRPRKVMPLFTFSVDDQHLSESEVVRTDNFRASFDVGDTFTEAVRLIVNIGDETTEHDDATEVFVESAAFSACRASTF